MMTAADKPPKKRRGRPKGTHREPALEASPQGEPRPGGPRKIRAASGGGRAPRTSHKIPAVEHGYLRTLSDTHGMSETLVLCLIMRRAALEQWRLAPEQPPEGRPWRKISHSLPALDRLVLNGEVARTGAVFVSRYLAALLAEARRREWAP